MKILDLYEVRRNPDKNPKVSINQLIIDRVDSTTDKIAGVINLFASFTSVDKLGINPRSPYNTPLGIYAYPAEYVVDVVGSNKEMTELPFAGGAPFVNLFNAAGNIVNVATMSAAERDALYDKIYEYWQRKSGLSQDAATAQIDKIVDNASHNATFTDHPGGELWYVTMMVATDLLAPKYGQRPAILWNKLFREMGVDGVIDFDTYTGQGIGVIHTSEPSQAVFFSRAAVTGETRHQNKYSPSVRSRVRKQQGEKKHEQLVKTDKALSGMTNYSDILAYLRDNDDVAIRAIKDPAIKTRLLSDMPAAIRHLRKTTPEQQIAALKSNPNVLKYIQSPDQSAVAFLLVNHPEVDLPVESVVQAFTVDNKVSIGEQLQKALVQNEITNITRIPHPSRASVALAVELASKKYHKIRDQNIPEEIAVLAIKHGVPYNWRVTDYHRSLLDQMAAVQREIEKLHAEIQHIDDAAKDLSDVDEERAALMRKGFEIIKQGLNDKIEFHKTHIDRRLEPSLKRLDYLYKNSITGGQ